MYKLFTLIFLILLCIMVIMYFREKQIKKISIDLPVVEIVQPKIMLLPDIVYTNGIIRSIKSLEISSSVNAEITKIFYKSGQYVLAGQVLVVLDHANELARLKISNAKLNYLIKNFKRFLLLGKKGIISKDYLDRLQSVVDQEKARNQSINEQLQKYFIRAPFSGYVGIKKIEVGQYVKMGEPLLNLQQYNSILIDLSVNPQYVNKISIGETVFVDKKTMAKIVAVDSGINSNTHSLTVRAFAKENKNHLFPGSYVSAAIVSSQAKPKLTLPLNAINHGINSDSVFFIQDKHAYLQEIDDYIQQNVAVIKKGINFQQEVVIAGQEKLYDGVGVTIKRSV